MANEPSASVPATPESTSEWVSRIGAGGIQGLLREFNTIRSEPMAGTIKAYEDNPELNRYNNIPLLDASRVKINDGLNPAYIHASYVDGFNRPKGYIISQAPVRKAIADYWRMVWAEKTSLIVCLTSLNERGAPKADQFFPMSTERPFRAGPFRVVAESIQPLPSQHRTMLFHLNLVCDAAAVLTRRVMLIYYGNWPDTAVPQRTADFLQFVRYVRHMETFCSQSHKGPQRPPVLVHCSAGIGRSATLVACRIALDQLEAADKVDIAGVVRRMRRQRAMAVQNVLQYIFINLLIAEATKQLFGKKPTRAYAPKNP